MQAISQANIEKSEPRTQQMSRISHEYHIPKRDVLISVLGEETLRLLSGKALLLDNAKSETRANAASTRVRT